MSQSAVSSGAVKNEYRLSRDTAVFLLALCATVFSAMLGYFSVPFLLPDGCVLSLVSADPYAGCQTIAAYILRAASLCRPILFQTAVLWISAYVQFENALLCFVFFARGVSLGIALHLFVLSLDSAAFAFLPIAYMAVTVVFLLLTRGIHTESGARSASESFILAMIAAGAASCVLIAVSLLHSY